MSKSPELSSKVLERGVRMVFDAKGYFKSHWSPIESIASKIDCTG